jgi:hypothetical protein
MRYQIIARRMSPPNSRHFQHIVEVRWQAGGQIGDCTRQQMVAAIEGGHTAFVQGEGHQSEVGVYTENGIQYLRSHADGYWDDNLLALPTF